MCYNPTWGLARRLLLLTGVDCAFTPRIKPLRFLFSLYWYPYYLMPSVFQMDCTTLHIFLMFAFLIPTVFAHKFNTRWERHQNRLTSNGATCSAGTYSSNGNTPCTPSPAGSFSKGKMTLNIVLLDVYVRAQTVPPSHEALQGLGMVYLRKGPRPR